MFCAVKVVIVIFNLVYHATFYRRIQIQLFYSAASLPLEFHYGIKSRPSGLEVKINRSTVAFKFIRTWCIIPYPSFCKGHYLRVIRKLVGCFTHHSQVRSYAKVGCLLCKWSESPLNGFILVRIIVGRV